MQGFVADLLTQGGALVEPIEPEGLAVMAPPAMQGMLGVDEFCRFGFGATLPAGAQRVGIESDWLSRFEGVMAQRGRWSRQVICPPTRKAPDAGPLLDRELVLDNATCRLLDAAPAWTRYLVLEFRFTALSDEKREGTRSLAINLATGAIVDALSERLEPSAGLDDDTTPPDDSALPADWERGRLIDRIRRALPWRVESALAPFVTGLRRRLARDLDRLHAYHNDLHREASLRAMQANAGDDGRQRERLRMAAIGQEYRAKLDDLAHKYALRVTVDWVRTQELIMPVHRLTAQIRRRKADRVVHLDWNPLARRLEPPPCEASWSAARPRLVCDEALHLVAPAGRAPCAGGGRAYCRACHPQRCPRCEHAGALAAFATVASPSGESAPH